MFFKPDCKYRRKPRAMQVLHEIAGRIPAVVKAVQKTRPMPKVNAPIHVSFRLSRSSGT